MAVARKRTGRRKEPIEANDPAELARICARAAEDKKGEEIAVLDLRGLLYVTDFFVIASGSNPRQLQAMQAAILQEMAQQGARPLGLEGTGQARWVLMDFGDFVVHLFDPEWRRLYDLELLWGDAPRLPWQEARRRRKTNGSRKDAKKQVADDIVEETHDGH